jgi:TctA family transporter
MGCSPPLMVSPDLFWGTIVSMYIGNGMLLVLNLPLIPLWVMVLRVPYSCFIPDRSINRVYIMDNNATDVVMMLVFGVGHLMKLTTGSDDFRIGFSGY